MSSTLQVIGAHEQVVEDAELVEQRDVLKAANDSVLDHLVALEAGQRGRIHRHKRQEEVYLVLEGALTLLTDDGEQTLGPGELARVAHDVRRQLVNRTRTRVVLVAIGGAGEHDSGDGEIFTDWSTQRISSPRDVAFPDDLDPSELH